MVNEHRWLVSIFCLYVLLAVGYSLLMPIWEAPDEPGHYHIVWHLVVKGNYASEKINYEARQPRLYYYFASTVIGAIHKIRPRLTDYYLPKEYKYNIRVPERRFDWNDKNYRFLLGVYALRWINILFGGMALWLNWRTFKLIAPDKPTLQLAALALAALTPQYLHIMSSVNNDALGTLAGALLLLLTIRFLKEPLILAGLFLIVFAILLPFSTKLTVLPMSAAALMLLAWQGFRRFPHKRWLFYAALLIVLLSGVFYLLFPQVVQFSVSEITWRLFSLRKDALTVDYIKSISGQIISTFWGRVGWLAVPLPAWILVSLTTLGLIGMTNQMRETIKSRSVQPQTTLWVGVWGMAIFTILAVFRNGLTTIASQGRFLFPAMGALSLLMVAGLHNIASERVQRFFPLLMVLLFLSCTIILWLSGIIPVYYQPFLD